MNSYAHMAVAWIGGIGGLDICIAAAVADLYKADLHPARGQVGCCMQTFTCQILQLTLLKKTARSPHQCGKLILSFDITSLLPLFIFFFSPLSPSPPICTLLSRFSSTWADYFISTRLPNCLFSLCVRTMYPRPLK